MIDLSGRLVGGVRDLGGVGGGGGGVWEGRKEGRTYAGPPPPSPSPVACAYRMCVALPNTPSPHTAHPPHSASPFSNLYRPPTFITPPPLLLPILQPSSSWWWYLAPPITWKDREKHFSPGGGDAMAVVRSTFLGSGDAMDGAR